MKIATPLAFATQRRSYFFFSSLPFALSLSLSSPSHRSAASALFVFCFLFVFFSSNSFAFYVRTSIDFSRGRTVAPQRLRNRSTSFCDSFQLPPLPAPHFLVHSSSSSPPPPPPFITRRICFVTSCHDAAVDAVDDLAVIGARANAQRIGR